MRKQAEIRLWFPWEDQLQTYKHPHDTEHISRDFGKQDTRCGYGKNQPAGRDSHLQNS
jgi:hypothetical protein